MLAKRERLSREQFQSFFKSGRRRHCDMATVVYTPYPTFHGSVVVSKKVAKKAVDRNRIRRQVYAQLYLLKKQEHPGVFVVLVKPGFMAAPRKLALGQISSLIEGIVKPA
jgi:ribonuclease P protein component